MLPTPTEIWLCLDLSSRRGSLALHKMGDGGLSLLAERSITEEGNHSERLLETLDEALKSTSVPLSTIRKFICGLGPGSFTGLRIAMATLKAFAYSSNQTIVGVSVSEARALGWLHESARTVGEQDAILVVTPVSQKKRTEAFYWGTGNKHLKLEGEKTLESDLASAWPNVPGQLTTINTEFPLSARHLALAAVYGKTRQAAANLNEWAALSPHYFGTSIGTTCDV